MKLLYQRPKFWLMAALIWVFQLSASGQCPHVFDFYGQVNDNPYWYSCSGNNFTFNLSTPDSWNGFSIDWGDGSPLTVGASWAPPAFQSHVYTATVDTFNVTITETSTGCVVTGVVVMEEASSASIQIPVGGLTQACAPQMMEFINSSTNVSPTTVFTWDFGDGSDPLVFDYTNWNQTIQHVYEIGTVTCETEVTLTAENYCNIVQGGLSTATFNPIRIWDLDDPAITASATLLCYPDTTVTFTNTTYRNCLFQGNIYQRYEYWNFGDYWGLGHDSIIDWTPWPPTFPHTMHYPGIGTYTVELLDSNYCGVAPASITIQIVPPPVAGISVNPDTVCVGQTVTFYQQATGGANVYKWNFGLGTGWFSTGSGNITYAFTSPGTYHVGSMVGIAGANGCSDTAWVDVVVLPNPSVNILVDVTSGCDAILVDFDAVTPNAVTWDWSFGVPPGSSSIADPPLIAYNTPGSYNVSLTVTNQEGCSSTDTETIHVHPSPIVDFTVFDLCEGVTASFTDLTTHGQNDDIVSWNWSFGDGYTSTQQNPNHLYSGTGQFVVELTVMTENCMGTDTMSVSVLDAPVADFSADIQSGCSPLTVNFTNSSDPAYVYHWNMGDGFESQNFGGQHTFYNTGDQDTTYIVTLEALNEFGCGGSDILYITVHPGSIADFTDGNPLPGCSPFAATFTNLSENAISYLWNFDDGSTSNLVSPIHSFNNNTTVLQIYDVTLIAYNVNGCNDTVTHPVVVYPLAEFDFSLAGNEGCSPLTVTMPFVAGVQSFYWDFGDGSTSAFGVPVHTFNNDGNTTVDYTVTLVGTSAFGCTDTASSTVTVHPSPVSQFSVNQTSGCGPLTVEFTNLSINADSYTWDYGDGSTSTLSDMQHSYTFENNTSSVITRTITLFAENAEGCTSQFALNIQIYPQITADFVDPGEYCSPVTVSFSNTSINATSYSWDFGNGMQSVAQNPSSYYAVSAANSQDFVVGLIATSMYGCTDTVYHELTVLPSPTAGFDIDMIAGCSPVLVNFTNTTVNADSLSWDFGDGITSGLTDSVFQHIYTNTGTTPVEFDIVLTASTLEGCYSQHQTSITVYPQIIAAFEDPGVYCTPATVQFVNNSLNAAAYQWDFGNGLLSVMEEPMSVFTADSGMPEVYPIVLITTSSYGCTDTAAYNLTVNPRPLVDITPDLTTGCSPFTVNFSNSTVYADELNWNFGDGNTIISQDSLVSHQFVNTGTSPITFEVIVDGLTSEGCADQQSFTITVYPEVLAQFGDPDAFCAPAAVAFTNSSINATAYEWSFGNGAMSVLPEPTTYYSNDSEESVLYNVVLIASNAYGCSDTVQHDVLMNPTPVAAFTPDVPAGCSPLLVSFINTTTNADFISWDYGDGSASDVMDSQHVHVFENNGSAVETFNVMMTASNVEGCSSQANASIQVYPLVEASFMDPGEHCSPVNVTFVNTSTNAVSYSWDFGNGIQSIMPEPTIYFVNTTDQSVTYNVQLNVASTYGCNTTVSMPLVIHPKPVASFTLSQGAACEPSPVEITNTSSVATSFTWNYGDGTTSQEDAVQHIHDFGDPINGSSQYDIVLAAVSDFGCVDTASGVFILYPDVTAAFTADSIGCSPFNTLFMNQSQGAASYQWSFGDAQVSTQTSPSHIFTAGFSDDEVYQVELVAMNIYGCTDTAQANIYVMHTPAAIAQIDTLAGCYPTVATFYNGSIGADSYLWSYGTGITSTTDATYHTYEYINVTDEVYTYPVILTAFTDYGCSDQTNLTIDIAPEITADFYSIQEGCTPLEIFFDNTSEGGDSYFWDFGDGDISSEYEPHHTFFNWSTSDTVYTVTFILSDSFGCSDTVTRDIYVLAQPAAGFDASPTVQMWPEATIALDNTTIGGAVSSTWYMGDGNFLFDTEPGSYTYQEWGEFEIQLVVSNGSCSDTTYNTVQILAPSPVADFEGPAEGCAPLQVSFTNLSENAMVSNWYFGDGGQSNATNPVYTYWLPGTYTVTLVVLGPDGSTDQITREEIIHVYPRAQAAFAVTPNEVNVPGEPVYCLNLSTNASEYLWSFGDGVTSTEENPLHYYQEEGEYSVQLIADNVHGCPDTLTLPDVVTALASGLIEFPNAFTPSPNGGSGGFFDPRSFDNDVFFPIHNGVEEYQLQIFNKWGELLFESKDVNRGWDGYYRGQMAKQDVYVWKVWARFIDGRVYERAGDVTLIAK